MINIFNLKYNKINQNQNNSSFLKELVKCIDIYYTPKKIIKIVEDESNDFIINNPKYETNR
jgi:hypothetical protein